MEIRTDLAMESRAIQEAPDGLPGGVALRREQRHGTEATVVELKTKAAAEAIGKPRGTYVTVELGKVLRREKESFEGTVAAIAEYLQDMLNLGGGLPVLVAGLGNR